MNQTESERRLEYLREWLRSLTSHELHLLKSRLIHDEQCKRRGIIVTPRVVKQEAR